jgi:hypothetical protein
MELDAIHPAPRVKPLVQIDRQHQTMSPGIGPAGAVPHVMYVKPTMPTAMTPPVRAGRSRRGVLVLLVVFALSLPAVTTRLYASDEIQYFAWLRSWVFDRDIDFENEYRHFHDSGIARNPLFHETFLVRVNENGRRINFGPIGSAVLWAPFYLAGHLWANVTGAATDGFSHPYIAAIAYGSACYGFLAVLLSAAIARRVVGRGLAASLAVAAGTPLLFYIYIAPPMSHANSAFVVSLFLWLWLRARERWRVRDSILLGLAGGLMAMVREQDVLFAVAPAIDFAIRRPRVSHPRSTSGVTPEVLTALAGVAAFLVVFSAQLLAYQALNGHPGPTELTTRKLTWTSPHAFGVVLSPEHGLFFWTPLALVAIAGLVVLAFAAPNRLRSSSFGESTAALATAEGAALLDPAVHPDARWIAALGLLMFALQVFVSGAVESWTVAGSFGQRRFVALTPLLTLGVAALFTRLDGSSWRHLLRLIVLLCIWWNVGLIVQFGAHRMDRQRLSIGTNAWTTFVELPREAPSLAWRYLTDRSSFYQRPRQ